VNDCTVVKKNRKVKLDNRLYTCTFDYLPSGRIDMPAPIFVMHGAEAALGWNPVGTHRGQFPDET
jgi:hypothetical protein